MLTLQPGVRIINVPTHTLCGHDCVAVGQDESCGPGPPRSRHELSPGDLNMPWQSGQKLMWAAGGMMAGAAGALIAPAVSSKLKPKWTHPLGMHE